MSASRRAALGILAALGTWGGRAVAQAAFPDVEPPPASESPASSAPPGSPAPSAPEREASGGAVEANGPNGSAVTGEGRVLRPYVRPPPGTEEEEEKSAPSRGPLLGDLPYRHDGFYLRFGLGAGFLHDRLRGDWSGYALPAEGGKRGSLTAFSGASELAVGGSLSDGVVIGVGLYTLLAPAPSAETMDYGSYEFDIEQLVLIGPMIDVYPWPSLGWHAELALGSAALTVGDAPSPDGTARPIEDHVAIGPGFVLGAGHEWWLGERLSGGLVIRWQAGWGAGKGFDGSRFVHREGGGAALFAVTFQ